MGIAGDRLVDARVLDTIARRRAERAASVPCGLLDENLCEDPGECPLVNDYDCPARIQSEKRAEAARQASAAAKAIEEAAIACGIPRRIWTLIGVGCEGTGLRDTVALRAVRGMTGTFLVLNGPTGTGKTVAACDEAWRQRGRVVKASRIARMSWYDEPRVDALMSAPLLVIDELGVECDDAKGVWRSRLDELCDHRYDAALRTIITTNLPESSVVPGERTLIGLVGARVLKRWQETGVIVSCTGADLRAQMRLEVG